MKIEFQAIGIVHSPFKQRSGTPIQPSRAAGARGKVEIFPEFSDGLCDLGGFSHIVLLYYFHQSTHYEMKVVPFLDTQARGLFSTRAPNRPNPIGLSVVELVKIDGNVIIVKNLDMIDGTPLLDIKPYVGEFDSRKNARFGWLDSVRKRTNVADDRFE